MNIPAHPMGLNGIKLLLMGPNGLKKTMKKASVAKTSDSSD
jgi:hypothetical protein